MWYGVMNARCLATKAIEGAALALECIHDVKGGDSFALCVLRIGDCISDNTVNAWLDLGVTQLG